MVVVFDIAMQTNRYTVLSTGCFAIFNKFKK